jgi:hypothetical protein
MGRLVPGEIAPGLRGEPLAQNRLSYNLAINFPTPLDFSDEKAISFAREKIDKTARLSDVGVVAAQRPRPIALFVGCGGRHGARSIAFRADLCR